MKIIFWTILLILSEGRSQMIEPGKYNMIVVGKSCFQDVKNCYGIPDSVYVANSWKGRTTKKKPRRCKIKVYQYDSLGIRFIGKPYTAIDYFFNKADIETINTIEFVSPFEGSTKENIKIGSNYEEVINAYKNEEILFHQKDSAALLPNYGFLFYFENKTVKKISISYSKNHNSN